MVAEFTPQFSAAYNLPPQSIDAEESLLGAILLDPQTIHRVANRLLPEAFFISAHQLIYKAALSLHHEGVIVDLMTVTTYLYDHKWLDKIGGQCRLAELVSSVVSSINADRYADLIMDKFIRRQLIQVGHQTIQAAYETFRKLPEIFTEAKERLAALMNSPLLTGEDPDQFTYNKICLEVQQIELNTLDPGLRRFKLNKLAKQYGSTLKEIESIYFLSLLREENESLLTWKELCDKYGDTIREWILHGFLPKGVTVALHAKGGVGKTRLVYDMLYPILCGSSWNGFPTTGAKRAILIQTDESAGDMLTALRQRGFDTSLDNIRYKTRWTIEHIPHLRAEIEEFHPEVIVIDSITSVNRHTLFKENEVEYARPILKLRDLAQQYGCTIILIHHSSKSGDARGTSAIFNSVSEVWKLEKDAEQKAPDSTRRILTIEKSRSRRPTAYRLDFEPEEGAWKLIGEVGVDENNPDLSTKERIVQFLLNNLNVRYEAQEIAEEINGATARTRQCCAQLAADGAISHVRPVGKGRGQATLYFIANGQTSESDRVNDCPDHFSESDRPPRSLFFPEYVRVSGESDRPPAKNTPQAQEEGGKKSDRPITLRQNPSNSKENKVIGLSDRVNDRPNEGDHLNERPWTKAIFAELSDSPYQEKASGDLQNGIGDTNKVIAPPDHFLDDTNKVIAPPDHFLDDTNKVIAPPDQISEEDLEDMAASGFDHFPEADEGTKPAVAVSVQKHQQLHKGQWGRLTGMGRILESKLVWICQDPQEDKPFLATEANSPEFENGVLFYGTVYPDQFVSLTQEECLQLGLSKVKLPPTTPYDMRNNPPKKGDRIRNAYGEKGQISEIRKTNPKYVIAWDKGDQKAYDIKGLQILDIQKEG